MPTPCTASGAGDRDPRSVRLKGARAAVCRRYGSVGIASGPDPSLKGRTWFSALPPPISRSRSRRPEGALDGRSSHHRGGASGFGRFAAGIPRGNSPWPVWAGRPAPVSRCWAPRVVGSDHRYGSTPEGVPVPIPISPAVNAPAWTLQTEACAIPAERRSTPGRFSTDESVVCAPVSSGSHPILPWALVPFEA